MTSAFVATGPEQTRELGERLGGVLRGGDVLLLVGDLGAGKTTFVQGVARGLGVEGRVTSPTYIIARVHESLAGGPDLIHVDAYRVGDELDLETIDLDATVEDSVTVVEWGRGHAEALSDNRLEIEFAFDAGGRDEGSGEAAGDSYVTGVPYAAAGIPSVLDATGAADEAAETEVRVVSLRAFGQGWQERLREAGLA